MVLCFELATSKLSHFVFSMHIVAANQRQWQMVTYFSQTRLVGGEWVHVLQLFTLRVHAEDKNKQTRI